MKLKFVFLLSSLLFLFSFAVPIANSAQIKNGVSCSTLGAKTSIGSKMYVCAKNPYVKPSMKTWTLKKCTNAYKMWKGARKQYEDWEDIAKLAGPEGEKTLQDLQTSIMELETIMKNEVCKKGA